MPVGCRFDNRSRLYRVVERVSGRITVGADGNSPVDGGGHKNESDCLKQVGAINSKEKGQIQSNV